MVSCLQILPTGQRGGSEEPLTTTAVCSWLPVANCPLSGQSVQTFNVMLALFQVADQFWKGKTDSCFQPSFCHSPNAFISSLVSSVFSILPLPRQQEASILTSHASENSILQSVLHPPHNIHLHHNIRTCHVAHHMVHFPVQLPFIDLKHFYPTVSSKNSQGNFQQ